jgi:uncharacterized membrane protein YccC
VTVLVPSRPPAPTGNPAAAALAFIVLVVAGLFAGVAVVLLQGLAAGGLVLAVALVLAVHAEGRLGDNDRAQRRARARAGVA